MLSFYLLMIEEPDDKSHFEVVYTNYKNDIMRYAITLTKNHHDAEELCQDAWFVIAKKFDSLKSIDDEKIKIYLVKTVKYIFFDSLKKKEKEKAIVSYNMMDNLDVVPDSLDSVLLEICERETVENIYNCINSLDEIYRDVLDFYFINHSSPKDIAEFMKIDVRTVRKRIERGRAMLISMLIKKGEVNGKKELF